jgi:polysaccharide biosynthesis transport protein
VDNQVTLLPLLKRSWWALLIAAFLAGTAAYVLASNAAPTYKAEVKLLVGPINATAGELDASGELGRTYSELAVSRPVLQSAIERTGARMGTDDLQKRVSATSNEISRIVSIGVEAGRASLAAELANAIAKRLQQLSQKGPGHESEAVEEFMHETEVEALTSEQRGAVEAAAKRSFAESTAGLIQIVDPAQAPKAPVAPMVALMTLLGGLAGLLVAGIAAVVKDSAGEALEDEASFGQLAEGKFLGAVDAPRSNNPEVALPVWMDPESPAAERYRLLAAKIGFLGIRPPLGSLLVLDAGDGRTSGVVAANLAAVLIEADWRVLLVDADTTGGGFTRLLQLDGEPGYRDLVESSERAELNGEVEELLVRQSDDLNVLPIGTSEALATIDVERAQRILDRLRSAADVVVVSAPPIRRSPAALVWARVTDSTVLAAEAGRTSREQLREALDSLDLIEASVSGTVLARSKPAGGIVGTVRTLTQVRGLRRERVGATQEEEE